MNQRSTTFNSTPQAPEVESAVLGSILTEKDAFPKIENILTEDCFFDNFHRAIYRAIIEVSKNNRPDANLVREKLKSNPDFDNLAFIEIAGQYTYDLTKYAFILQETQVERKVIELGHEYSERIMQGEDIADVVFQFGKDLESLQESLVGKSQTNHVSAPIGQALNQMYTRMDNYKNGIVSGIYTGLVDLNRLTNGWQRSNLIVIAARPAMGKTAVALHFAKSAAKTGVPVAMFSLEMSEVSLANRLLLSETSIDPDDFRAGRLTSDQAQEMEKVAGIICPLPIYIDGNSIVSMGYIHSKCRILQKQHKCSMAIIDYLQLAEEKGAKNRNREQEISAMSREAKIIAKELEMPVLLLSQLNRSVESRTDKKPMLSDLRESGAIEQDADMVIFIHRPEYYGEKVLDSDNNEIQNYGELIIAKNRDGAAGKTVKFQHDGSLTKIFDFNNGYTIPKQSENEPF